MNGQILLTGKSLSEAPIFASTDPKYDDRLFIELQVQYKKIRRTCCVQKFFDIQNNFCTQYVLQKEDLLTKIYLYQAGVPNKKYHLQILPKMYYSFRKSCKVENTVR